MGVKRLAGAYLAVVGAAVAIHFVLDPLLYEWESGEGVPAAWIALDWLMGVGLAIALYATFIAKRGADRGSDLRAYLVANTQFFVAAGLTLLFLWNAFQISWSAGDQTPDAQVWVLIDVVLPMLFVTVGMGLWSDAESEGTAP